MTITGTASALAPNLQANFLASGGTSPYTYSVRAGGAGGTIDSSTGWYTAPAAYGIDTLVATDSDGNTATTQVLVGSAIQLFCDVIQTEMGLAQGRVYLWDQKVFQPTDQNLYIAVGIERCKPYGNTNRFDGSSNSDRGVNMQATLFVEAISRGIDALNRKEEIIMALASDYSLQQQSLNQFYIAPITSGFTNLSEIDGAAIPYRFHLSVNIMYLATKTVSTDYFNDFQTPTEVVEA